MTQRTNRTRIPTRLMCRGRMHSRARSRPMNRTPAPGVPPAPMLFDIVNVPALDAAPSPAHPRGCLPLRERPRVLFFVSPERDLRDRLEAPDPYPPSRRSWTRTQPGSTIHSFPSIASTAKRAASSAIRARMFTGESRPRQARIAMPAPDFYSAVAGPGPAVEEPKRNLTAAFRLQPSCAAPRRSLSSASAGRPSSAGTRIARRMPAPRRRSRPRGCHGCRQCRPPA